MKFRSSPPPPEKPSAIVLYKGVHCSLCNSQHDLWLDESGAGLTYKPHGYTCPRTGQRTVWAPNVFAHLVAEAPANAVPLVVWFTDQPANPSPANPQPPQPPRRMAVPITLPPKPRLKPASRR